MRATFVFFVMAGWLCFGQSVDYIEKIYERPFRAAIFSDAFESGDASAWVPELLNIPNCNCYFSSDCPGNQFCYWGPGGPGMEDHCHWRLPKPQGMPGEGCFEDHVGGPGPICDGVCTDRRAGSLFGHEDPELVIEAIQLWAEAMLRPSLTGGGPVDPILSERALSLPFQAPQASIQIGRHVADMLILSGGSVFYDYFCHFEYDAEGPDYYVDLSGEPCAYQAGVLLIDAVIAELSQPGAGAGIIDRIPNHCSEWQSLFTARCPSGPEALDCIKSRVADYGTFLTRPGGESIIRGNLAVSQSARFSGNYGLRCDLTGGGTAYVEDDSPSGEATYRARFYVNTTNLTLGDGDEFDMFAGFDLLEKTPFRLTMVSINDQPHLRLNAVLNTGVEASSAPGGEIPVSPGYHSIEVNWAANFSNGFFRLSLNDQAYPGLENLNNGLVRVEFVRLGALTDIPPTTTGYMDADNFISNQGAAIGMLACSSIYLYESGLVHWGDVTTVRDLAGYLNNACFLQ